MTAPFARWRDSYRDLPGQLPSRVKLGMLAPGEIVGVRADLLLQLVVQAENHDAPCVHEPKVTALFLGGGWVETP